MQILRGMLGSARLIIVGILPLALLVRLLGITLRYIWYDEAFSLLLSSKGPAGILASTLDGGTSPVAADVHPPLYYFILSGWMRNFGDSVPSAHSTMFSTVLKGTLLLCKQESEIIPV